MREPTPHEENQYDAYKESWQKAFKDEFGIHFKNSSGELQFAIAFIEDLLKAQALEIIKEVEKLSKYDLSKNGTDKEFYLNREILLETLKQKYIKQNTN